MVDDFYSLIERIKSDIELELSKRSLIEQIALRIYMPLTINLILDLGSASLTILKDFSISLSREPSQAPDNTIHATFETLRSLYYSPDQEKFLRAERKGRIRIVSHTSKGRVAEKKLRELLKG